MFLCWSVQPECWFATCASPTELAGLCREAALAALREGLVGAQAVAARHFATARAEVAPALTASDLAKHEAWGFKFSR